MESCIVVCLPRRLFEEVRRRGIDVESRIVDVLLRELGLDPDVVADVRVELAEKYLNEAKMYLEKGDPVQASEKMYKAAEECIKALAELFNIPESEKARETGRWWTHLLGKAARRLAKQLNEPKIETTWSIAYDIHVWGFHETKYTIEDIEQDIKHIEWLLQYTKNTIKQQKQ